MVIKRDWATSITIGAFFISSVTGVLMFFHLDVSLNKLAHEWLSWLFLLGVLLHVVANFTAFKKYFLVNKNRKIIGLISLLLLLSFIPLGTKNHQKHSNKPMEILTKVPFSTLAIVSEISPEEMLKKLNEIGSPATSVQQSIEDLVGDDLRKKEQLLEKLL